MQEKEPLISVIVPIYKVEKYIKQCLESIINQTYRNIEIILVDDGSPDNCPRICDEYSMKDNRIKVIHKENGGLSSARNAGLEICSGEYISFVDADDIISPIFIETLYKLILENKCDISQCVMHRFDDENQLKMENKSADLINFELLSCIDIQKKLFSRGCMNYVVTCNKLYKREIYNDLRFPIGRIHEDEFCTYKAFAKSLKGMAYTDAELYYYRKNENSITESRFSTKKFDLIIAYDQIVDFYTDKNDELYSCVLLRYNDILKDLYIKTNKYINEDKENNLSYLKNKLKENYQRIKNNKNISIKQKIIKYLICNYPYLYVIMANKR